MVWKVEIEREAERKLDALDHQVARRIPTFLHDRVTSFEDVRSVGQALKGSKLGEFWKYRVGRLPRHCADTGGHCAHRWL